MNGHCFNGITTVASSSSDPPSTKAVVGTLRDHSIRHLSSLSSYGVRSTWLYVDLRGSTWIYVRSTWLVVIIWRWPASAASCAASCAACAASHSASVSGKSSRSLGDTSVRSLELPPAPPPSATQAPAPTRCERWPGLAWRPVVIRTAQPLRQKTPSLTSFFHTVMLRRRSQEYFINI